MSHNPAQVYRAMIRQTCSSFVDSDHHCPDTDAAFCAYLEQHLATEGARLQQMLNAGASANDVRSTRTAIALLAVGLLTFGRIDMTEPILQGIQPAPPGFLGKKVDHVLANSLRALLPLPTELHPLYDPEAVRSWVQRHAGHLVWSVADGKYIMRE
jgi:hypothetical protein